MDAFLRAEEALQRERWAMQLTLAAVGAQGDRAAIERLQRTLMRTDR